MKKSTKTNNENSTLRITHSIIADIMKNNIKKITPNASFLYDLGFDSLDMLDLINRVECEFCIKIPISEYENDSIQTVNDLINIIKKQLSQKQNYIAPTISKTIQKTR